MPIFSNKSFHHALPPSVDVSQGSATSSITIFQPTHATLVHKKRPSKQMNWNSRNHRKQRYRPVTPRNGHRRHVKHIWWKIFRIFHVEYWNVSWWVGFLFTCGSIFWVVNGFQVWLPFVTSVPNEPEKSGWTAFVGASIYFFASWLLVLEGWNREDGALFGYALKHSLSGIRYRLADDLENGHVSEKTHEEFKNDQRPQKWIWFSTDPKCFREIGFVAGFIQFWAATIFWISGFAGISQILRVLQKHTAKEDGVYWVPQVVGGSGFIISSALYMLEAQRKWYIPALLSLGWHSAFWNLVGGIGFTLCGALGFSSSHGAEYQSTLSTFWGSWAFLIGSIIQWYESVNPINDVEEDNDSIPAPS